MSTVQEIFDTLCGNAPLELQMDFDNAGFLVGHLDQQLDTVLLALDITDAVIDEAIAEGAQLIVAHHPVIWDPLKSLTSDGDAAKVLRLAENHISAICMHTNLDIAEGGVNDVLMQKLGGEVDGYLDAEHCGRFGHLPQPVLLDDFLQRCKNVLHANGLRYCDAGRPVHRLAVMGGAGSDDIEDAARLGCDTYVTSDIKYHQFQRAAELGINLIDADHFCTENPVIPILAKKLNRTFPDVCFTVSARHHAVISFF